MQQGAWQLLNACTPEPAVASLLNAEMDQQTRMQLAEQVQKCAVFHMLGQQLSLSLQRHTRL